MKGNYIDIEIGDTNIIALELLNLINDTIIYISKSGYLIGDAMACISNKKCLEMKSKRPASDKKNNIIPNIINKLPKDLIYFLKIYERRLSYYDVVGQRTLYYDEDEYKKTKPKKILIFDDSIDTGYTIDKVIEEISKIYQGAEIKIAVLNYFTDRNSIKPDYYLYKDSVISAPWTIDSKEYKKFLNMYENRNNSLF